MQEQQSPPGQFLRGQHEQSGDEHRPLDKTEAQGGMDSKWSDE